MILFLQLFILVSLIAGYFFLADISMKVVKKLLMNTPTVLNEYLDLFYNVFLFTLLLVTITALAATKGKTIFILVPAIIYFYWRLLRNESEVSHRTDTSKGKMAFWGTIIFVAALTVTASFYAILKFSIRNDVSFYTKISECLIPQGIENPFHYYNNENPVFKGNVPYHYFEMWFGGLCFEIAQIMGIKALSNYLIYIFFVFNLFRVLVVIGILGLIINYVKLNYFHFIIVFLLLFIDISAYCNWGNDAYVAESNFFERPNFIFYYLGLIPLFHALLNDRKDQLITWGAIFILLTVTSLPAIVGGVMLYFLYEWFTNKTSSRRIVKLSALFVGFLICYACFYKAFGVSKEASLVENMSLGQMATKTCSIWKACVFMFGMLFFKISIIVLLSYSLIRNTLLTETDHRFINLHFFILLICLCGIGIFQLIPYLDNMYQFAFIGYCAAILLIMITISVKLQYLKRTRFYIGLSFFLLIMFYGLKRNLFFDHILIVKPLWNESVQTNFLFQNNLSTKFTNEIEELSDYWAVNKGASLIDEKDVLNEFLGLRHSMTFQLGNYLMAIGNNMHLPLVSDPSKLYPDTDLESKAYLKAYNFNKQTAFYKEYDSDSTYLYNLKKYITNNKINYLVTSKNYNVSALIGLKIRKRIQDNNTGHQILIFD